MRKSALFVLLALVAVTLFGSVAFAGPTCTPDPGPQIGQNTNLCFPTPQECATGNYNGVYDGGVEGRGSICVGAAGIALVYTGGNANVPCGNITLLGVDVTGNAGTDPNTCP